MSHLRKSSFELVARFLTLALAGCALAICCAAQEPGAQAKPAPPTVAGAVRNFYNNAKNNIIRSGEKMPEEFYGLRPGQQEEVRTFGQQLAHVARYNYIWCSEYRGEKNPEEGVDPEKTLKTKEEIMKAVRDSFDYCDVAFSSLNDTIGAETITITQESGRQVQQTRLGLLILDLVHTEEVYGSIVTTLRIKDIVPPSSEPRPRQQPPAQERNSK